MLASSRSTATFSTLRLVARTAPSTLRRALSTLPQNQHIYVHEQPNHVSKRYLYSYLDKSPPIPSLAIAFSPHNPPTPESLEANPSFLQILQKVIREHAVHDPEVKASAAMYASQAGSALGSGGFFFGGQKQRRQRKRKEPGWGGGGGGAGGDGAGGASAQGGMGGAGRGGYIHVSDQRNPPDFGRVAWPEDILGSLELDGQGEFVDGTGRYQESNTYRIMTNDGILGLSEYLRTKLIQRLRELDEQARRNA